MATAEKSITLAADDIYLFLLSAVRYALGRRTYIVGWACKQVRTIAPGLSADQRKIIAESIRRCEDYGDVYDKREWLGLLEWLENYDLPKIRKIKAKQ